MEEGGLSFGRFINKRLESLLTAVSRFNVLVVFTRPPIPPFKANDWDPKVSLSVSLESVDGPETSGKEMTALLETASHKTKKVLVFDRKTQVLSEVKSCR